ncbi:hypothetical protein GCM10023142_30730 [Anaerocolumna aminovalerica]|uniref:Uncharacterized protein n=1 Tax=Anaerocolumna aminovalerica TaxID=1527 RepID=A0A1I5EMB6_9FIRM|nr:hypothetical protein [Anaerocolumna aminovalerica]MDU6264158.1 hypothetical protein [Anaerocolumna aminovalerica]SFO12560.1 hypothetical protein SAMN04489757_11014 [Anaerocolumna aminovalerica]
MSAFLGPIHYWLYNKIKLQNNMVEAVIQFAKSKNLNYDLRSKLDNQYGTIDLRPLEEQIDTSNIHGWLQECVSTVEYRLADAVTTLLKEGSKNLEELKEIFRTLGEKESILSKDATIAEAYKSLNDTLLDGMPCDHANLLVSQEDNEIIWKRNLCVHENYWTEVGGDIKIYYILREEYIKGLLSHADITYEKLDETISRIVR